MSTAIYTRRPGTSEKHPYVIGTTSEDKGLRVLCVTLASGVKSLPVFSNREAARRFLRASPLRFNMFGLGWRTWRITEWGSLLVDPPDGIQEIILDPSPETLVGECGAEPLVQVT